MIKYLKYLIITLFVLAISLSSCDYNSNRNLPDYRIGIVPEERGSSFWKILRKGSYNATKELLDRNISIEVIWQAPAGINQWEDQVKLVEQLVEDEVDGILLSPVNRKSLQASLKLTSTKNIPVIIINSTLLEGDYITYIGSNNYEAGWRAGHYLANLLEEKGNVIMLKHIKDSGSSEDREKGFLEAISQYNDINVLSSELYAGETQDTAFRQSQKLLNRTQKKGIDGIFTSSQNSTNGMIFTLQKFPTVRNHSQFVGFDGGYLNINALNNGDIDALLIQDPEGMGYEAIMKMVSYLKGNSVPGFIYSDVIIVDQDNILETNIQNFLEPYFQSFSSD